MSFLKWIGGMGQGGSGKSVSSNSLDFLGPQPGSSERYFGFDNFGNTCYCNSVLQALYFCRPFRDCVLRYCYPESAVEILSKQEGYFIPTTNSTPDSSSKKAQQLTVSPSVNAGGNPASLSTTPSSVEIKKIPFTSIVSPNSSDTILSSLTATHSLWNNNPVQQLVSRQMFDEQNVDTLLSTLQALFLQISSQKKRTGCLQPKQFVSKLKSENEIFRNNMQQDAHEMFNYMLNAIGELLERQNKEIRDILERQRIPKEKTGLDDDEDETKSSKKYSTWVHELFEGTLTNETKCNNCENITNRDESFLDLSVDIEQHMSLSSCIRSFSVSEVLCEKNKFFCDVCNNLQEAEKRMKIKRLPNVLAIHLKRFKYQEDLGKFSKLSYRVPFTTELKLFNTKEDAENRDRMYDLCSIIVHIGSGPNSGHYVAIVRSEGQWLLFDDDDVKVIDESELVQIFGDPRSSSLGTGYLFLYTARDFNSNDLLSNMSPAPKMNPADILNLPSMLNPLSQGTEETHLHYGKSPPNQTPQANNPGNVTVSTSAPSRPSVGLLETHGKTAHVTNNTVKPLQNGNVKSTGSFSEKMKSKRPSLPVLFTSPDQFKNETGNTALTAVEPTSQPTATAREGGWSWLPSLGRSRTDKRSDKK